MSVVSGNVLCLVLGDRSAVLVQITTDKGRRTVQRVGRFDAGGARLIDKPAESGAALAAFLAANGFTVRKTIVGLPARWLIAQERELPPIDVNGAADLLRLAAERLSLAETGGLVADYAGAIDSKNPGRVLLVGMLKPNLDRVKQFIEAAGLQLAGACPTSLAVSAVVGGDLSVLRLTDEGAELVLQSNGHPRWLQPMTPDLASLGSELRRTLTMRGGSAADLMFSDGVGLTLEQSTDLSSRLSATPRHFGDDLGVTIDPAARSGPAAALPPDAHWPAVALAVAAAGKSGLPIDFTDSKLTVRPPGRFGKRTAYGAIAAVLAVAGFAWLVSTVNAREAEELRLAGQAKAQEKPVAEARVLIDQITYGRTYFDTRPPVLDCLKQVALMFNYEEPIWLGNLALGQNGRGQLLGKSRDDSRDQRLILSLLDRLKANPNFRDVNLQSVTETGGKEPLKTFSIGFVFQPAPPATSPSK